MKGLPLTLVLSGTVSLLAIAIISVQAGREFRHRDHLSTPTFLVLFAALVVLTLSIGIAAYVRVWPLPLPAAVANVSGAALIAFGLSLYLAARLRFGSFRLTWGLTLDRLVIEGVYRISRNPQTTGAVAFLLGASLLGRSGAAIALVVMYFVSCAIWIRMEEQSLERRFGEEYRRYRSAVPRFLS